MRGENMTNNLKADKSLLFRYNTEQISPLFDKLKGALRYRSINAIINNSLQIYSALIEKIDKDIEAGKIKKSADKNSPYCYCYSKQDLQEAAIKELCDKKADYKFLRV